jgi:glucose-6-phosphate dehydrogenase assembly protein OpcA
MDIKQVTGAEELPVNAVVIERELAKLWQTVGDPGNGDRSVTRASELTLVVPCTPEAVEAARSVVADLVATHPARVLLLVTEPGEASMTASVSAFCHRLGTTPQQVCCELITLRSRGAAEEHFPEAVLALLAPDQPVALWWPGGVPARATQLERLSALGPATGLGDRWIIDTAAALRQMTALFARREGRTAGFAGGVPPGGLVHDLAWMRLLPWRELTAQFFDPAAFRVLLPELDLLEVRTPAHTPPCAEALLWIAWLVDRLGWQLAPVGPPDGTGRQADRASRVPARSVDAGGRPSSPPPGSLRQSASVGGTPAQLPAASWRFLRPGGEGYARVLPPEIPSSDPDALAGVRLHVTASETTFTITRTPGTDCATLAVTTPGACPLPRAVTLPRPHTARLLADALDEPHADPLYLAALALAAELQH